MNKKASNPYELIEDKDVVRWLSLCGYDIEGMSDFEKLSAYMGCVSLMPDNSLKKSFFEKVAAILGEPLDPDMTAYELWQKGNQRIRGSWGLVVEDCGNCCGKTMTFSAKTGSVGEKPTKRFFDLNCFVTSIGANSIEKSFTESTNELLLELKQEKAPYCLALNIENIDFYRGDYYHAGLTYEKLVKDQLLAEEELEGYIFWLLSYVLEKLPETCVLYLNTGMNIACAKSLISYLEMRGLLPRIYIAVTKDNRVKIKELCNLCLLIKNGKITLDLVLKAEWSPSVVESRLKELLEEYPVQVLSFSGDGETLKTVKDILNK